MDFIRAYKFRIYPDPKRQSEINLQLILSKNFYNKLLELAKTEYENGNTFKINRSTFNRAKKDITSKNKDFLKIYSQTRCEIEDRGIRAYQNFSRRVKEKKSGKKINVGFSRFKSTDRYHSIVYPQDNGAFSIEQGRLRVSRIGTMKIDLHRKIEGNVKTLTIKREAGLYYAIFTTIKEETPTRIADTNPIGIDLGLKSFIVLSDGNKEKKPEFMKEGLKGVARWQKIVARRQKASNRRMRAKLRLQKEYKFVANKSNDYLHKLSNKLIHSRYTSFSIENLNINNMVKNHNLSGSIYDASWDKFVKMPSYKAESAGMRVDLVDPRYTSQICSNCGSIQCMPLPDRLYVCRNCGMKKDRDVNAAINILKRAREGHSRSNAQGDDVRLQQAAVIEDLGTYSSATDAGRGSPQR